MSEAEDISTWPHWLRRFAEVIGAERTLALAQKYGGLDKLYLPKTPRDRHLWLGVLTEQEYGALCARFGGQCIAFPRSAERNDGKKQQVLALLDSGLSDREISIQVGVGQRHIRRIRAELGLTKRAPAPDPRQIGLFD